MAFKNLHILFPNQLYPETGGALIRTLNIAKLASNSFNDVSIFAADEHTQYINKVDNVNLIQRMKYKNAMDKISYYFCGLFSNNFSLKAPTNAFNKGDTLFQIEDPLFYNLLRKNDIKNYILNEHNVWWELPLFPQNDMKYKIYNRLATHRDIQIELKALTHASHVLVCSERDKQLILTKLPNIEEKISVIPNCIDFKEYYGLEKTSKKSIYHENYEVLFVGTLSYPPNFDAISLICNYIAPNCDDIEFVIVGKNSFNIKLPKNVRLTGYVKDAKKYIIQSDICIAPLRFGSGTRIKILEYMALGKPVISTTKGAEGIDYIKDKNIIIEDNIELYPFLIRELLENREKMNGLGTSARNLIERKYNWHTYKKEITKIYSKTCIS